MDNNFCGEPPAAVRHLTVTPLRDDRLRVAWEPAPQDDKIIKTYLIKYHRVGNRSEIHEMKTTEPWAMLPDLRAYTEYAVTVTGVSWSGPGRESATVVGRTDSYQPLGAPLNVHLLPLGSSTLTVHWDPPKAELQNGVITGYVITYRNTTSRFGERVTVDGNRRTFSIRSLKPGQQLAVAVAAENADGRGPFSRELTGAAESGTANKDSVPGPVVSLEAVKFLGSPGRVTVTWTASNQTSSLVRGYRVDWGKNRPNEEWQIVDRRETRLIIDDLDSRAAYVVGIRPFNNAGGGPPMYTTVYVVTSRHDSP